MTQDFFKFRQTINEDRDDTEKRRKKRKENTATREQMESAFEDARDDAIEKSQHQEKHYHVYQNTVDFLIFKVCIATECPDKDDEQWLEIGYAEASTGKWIGSTPNYKRFIEGVQTKMTFEKFSGKGRRSLKRSARKNKNKLRLARLKAKKRRATKDRMNKRAMKRARKQIKNKLLKGRPIRKLSTSQLNRLNLMVDARPGQLDALRRKLLPKVRKDEFSKRYKKK